MQKFIEKELDLVEKKLKVIVSSKDEFVEGIAKYLFSRKGKRIRPILLLLSAHACNNEAYSTNNIVSIAAVVEMLHTASLIHDDVIDSSFIRRGIATVNSKWGNKISTLMGDYLYAKAASLMSDIGNNEVLKVITDATGRMCEGEMNQVNDSFNPYISEEKYIETINKKTASLFGTASESGAILAKANLNEKNILKNFGINLGISFQIIDDCLDIISNDGDTGKPCGSDLKDGKITLPYIYILRVADNKDKKIIIDGFGAKDGFKKVKSIAKEYKAIEYSREKAISFIETAKKTISKIQDSISRDELMKLSDFIVKRTY